MRLHNFIDNHVEVTELKYQADHNFKLTCEVFNLLGELLTKTTSLKKLRVECSSYPSAKDKILEALCVNDTVDEFCFMFTFSTDKFRTFDELTLRELVKWNTSLTKLKMMNVSLDINSFAKSLEMNTTISTLTLYDVKGDMSQLEDRDLHIEELEIRNTGFINENEERVVMYLDLSKITSPKKVTLDNIQLKGKFFVPGNIEILQLIKMEDYNLDDIFECLKTNTTLTALCLTTMDRVLKRPGYWKGYWIGNQLVIYDRYRNLSQYNKKK